MSEGRGSWLWPGGRSVPPQVSVCSGGWTEQLHSPPPPAVPGPRGPAPSFVGSGLLECKAGLPSRGRWPPPGLGLYVRGCGSQQRSKEPWTAVFCLRGHKFESHPPCPRCRSRSPCLAAQQSPPPSLAAAPPAAGTAPPGCRAAPAAPGSAPRPPPETSGSWGTPPPPSGSHTRDVKRTL